MGMWITPRKCRPGNDDQDARDLGEERQVLGHELAQDGRRGAEHDEHRGEAEHEGDRRQHHRRIDVARRLVFAGELIERGTAEKAKIGRHERQHARAEEAQEAGDQRAEIGDIHGA